MNSDDASSPDEIGAALGRVPSGLFIVTTRDEEDRPLGFLGSFVQQVAIEPPTVCVAVAPEREHLAAIRRRGVFALSVLGEGDRGLMKPFFKKPEDGSPFDDVEVESAPNGSPVLGKSLSWLECRVTGEHDAGDHIVVFGTVESGAKRRDGEPLVHTRRSGLRYS
ncbi:MAG: flavin reductase family protein [Planctomycetota bacterium]